jgi:hypothetical protein
VPPFFCASGLQPHQIVEQCPALRASIDEISELHQCGSAACPLRRIIDQSCGLQNGLESIKVAVHVTYGNDAFGLRSLDGSRQKKE